MIHVRRHPLVSAGIALAILVPAAIWLTAIDLWWRFQGRNAWGRP